LVKTGSFLESHRLLRSGSIDGTLLQRPAALVGLVFCTVLMLGWTYWATIVDLFHEWQRNQDYSVGQLVPIIAIYLVWNERQALRNCTLRPCWSWGLAILVLAFLIRCYGVLFLLQSAERYSLVLAIIGLVLLMAGKAVFNRLRWILLFLVLMVPLPGRFHNMISGPLQRQATTGAVFLVELFGVAVVREGNIIRLNGTEPLAVAEACSGLRMLTAFVVVAATMAFIVHRPKWQKGVLLLSSIPIAIICNILRLWITAELFRMTNSNSAERFFHDFAGLTMMPLAVFILLGELILMNKIAQENTPVKKIAVGKKNALLQRKKDCKQS